MEATDAARDAAPAHPHRSRIIEVVVEHGPTRQSASAGDRSRPATRGRADAVPEPRSFDISVESVGAGDGDGGGVSGGHDRRAVDSRACEAAAGDPRVSPADDMRVRAGGAERVQSAGVHDARRRHQGDEGSGSIVVRDHRVAADCRESDADEHDEHRATSQNAQR